MTLDRSPSPQPGGGWASPGLNAPYDGVHVHRNGGRNLENGNTGGGVTWASAKAGSARVNGLASYRSQNEGFFGRHMRHISASLPTFMHGGEEDRYELKEKPLRSRSRWFSWNTVRSAPGAIPNVWIMGVQKNKYALTILFVLVSLLLWFQAELTYAYRRTSWLGGGSKFVIILAANEEGGVMYWKGAREWALERHSMQNKRAYAERWGYELETVDMVTKKKYAHEWRESWEKADYIRNAMKKYPQAEWFWWLDLNTLIMEPSYSLQWLLFDNLQSNTYRDINLNNPLGIRHPPNGTSGDPDAPQYANYLDPESLSVVGDGDPRSINLVLSQDCGGFNLGSFFARRSAWTDRLLDIWWDPVFYEQRHMEWEHKEQDALEYLYTNQPWIRSHIGFAPQRLINAFPDGACGDNPGLPKGGCKGIWEKSDDPDKFECGVQGIHYQKEARDFFINMAGCEWGRDCWAEMYNYLQMSKRLNRNIWEKTKDYVVESYDAWMHPPPPTPPKPPGSDEHHDEEHHDGEKPAEAAEDADHAAAGSQDDSAANKPAADGQPLQDPPPQ